jgi:hypothetical protein
MECATYMGTYTYLSAMENNIANWEEKIKGKQRADETYEYISQPQHVNKEGVEVNRVNEPVNEELLLEVIAQTENMTPELQAFYQTIPEFYNAAYGVGEGTTKCDCGGLSRGIYGMLGYDILEDGSIGLDTWNDPEAGVQTGSRVSRAWTASDSENIVYERDEFGQTPDLNILQPGDVIYYDLKGNSGKGNGWADHVAVYVGQNADGKHIIVETCSTDNTFIL